MLMHGMMVGSIIIYLNFLSKYFINLLFSLFFFLAKVTQKALLYFKIIIRMLYIIFILHFRSRARQVNFHVSEGKEKKERKSKPSA